MNEDLWRRGGDRGAGARGEVGELRVLERDATRGLFEDEDAQWLLFFVIRKGSFGCSPALHLAEQTLRDLGRQRGRR